MIESVPTNSGVVFYYRCLNDGERLAHREDTVTDTPPLPPPKFALGDGVFLRRNHGGPCLVTGICLAVTTPKRYLYTLDWDGDEDHEECDLVSYDTSTEEEAGHEG